MEAIKIRPLANAILARRKYTRGVRDALRSPPVKRRTQSRPKTDPLAHLVQLPFKPALDRPTPEEIKRDAKPQP